MIVKPVMKAHFIDQILNGRELVQSGLETTAVL
jgi:hypothetical protein